MQKYFLYIRLFPFVKLLISKDAGPGTIVTKSNDAGARE
jgi:hypothetical protein